MKTLICAVNLLAVSTAHAGNILYVDDDAPPGGNGLNWATAYQDLQDALDTASNGANGVNEIRIAQGCYVPTEQTDPPDAMSATFTLIDGVELRGGFAGVTDPDPDSRDVELYETKLSGEDELYHVLTAFNTTAATVIDGLTLSGGYAVGGYGGHHRGGGLTLDEGDITVLNCRVLNNIAATYGAGVSLFSNSNATFDNCTFTGNSCLDGDGGGLFSGGGGSATLHDCSFSGNFAHQAGGGLVAAGLLELNGCTFTVNFANGDGGACWIGLIDGGSASFSNCEFSSNASNGDSGGAVFVSGTGDLELDHCVFSGNVAQTAGGGVRIDATDVSATFTTCEFTQNQAVQNGGGGLRSGYANLVLTNCTFSDNQAGFAGGGVLAEVGTLLIEGSQFISNTCGNRGGGLHCSGMSSSVTNCSFLGNSSTANSGGGVAVQFDMYQLTNCVFAGNTADKHGGGMYNKDAVSIVTNCTFADNQAFGNTGGLYGHGGASSVTATNCILWGNIDADGQDESAQIADAGGSSSTENYCCIQGLTGMLGGVGNTDADPMFVDPDNGDLRLQTGSPCIDAADNTAVPEDITTDLDGNPRFLEIPETPDTGNGTLPIVDMGAYESLGGGCLAVTSQEIVCHADGTTFTVNIEGLNACTGGATQVTFTASGGAVGASLCFTALVNDGGFCCTTEICVTIPDCAPAALPSDLDGDGIVGIVDFLALLEAWGSCSDCGTCPADFDGDCAVGITDFLLLLGNWS